MSNREKALADELSATLQGFRKLLKLLSENEIQAPKMIFNISGNIWEYDSFFNCFVCESPANDEYEEEE